LVARLPHPIPYQGSKRSLAPLIAAYVPKKINTWYEPFAGSAAMSIWAASTGAAKNLVIADSLEPIVELWRAMIDKPDEIARRYEIIWQGQKAGVPDYFNQVRARYNNEREPVDLLYLICRCVKNAVRFNKQGAFTQSVDKRRLGMRPEKMRDAIMGVSSLLKNRTEVRLGDWLDTTSDARPSDFVYMDPPYLGTSVGRDKRYAHQMLQERLIGGLELFKTRTRTRETFRLRFFQNGPLGKGTGIEVELAQIDALAAELVNAASAIRASRKATSKMALAVK
jgi:DNA adenine methylase